MVGLKAYNDLGMWLRLLVAAATFLVAWGLLLGVFFQDDPSEVAGGWVATSVLAVPALVLVPYLLHRYLKWPVHAVPTMIIAAGGAMLAIAAMFEFDLLGNIFVIWPLLLFGVSIAIWLGMRAMREETDETAYIPLALKCLLGVLSSVLIFRLFFEWTALDGGRDLMAAGPVICAAIGLGYLFWHKQPFSWGLWPAGAIVGGAVFGLLV
jgi:hypothetical protein